MSDILTKIISHKREELKKTDFSNIKNEAIMVSRPVISFSKNIMQKNPGIIAEFKRHSPSKGWINKFAQVDEVISNYENMGAAACSILTESEFFKGSKDDLILARKTSSTLPLLRKDFIIDKNQIYEARVIGADAILLISACLTNEECENLAKTAKNLGLEVLLEVHNEEELDYISENIDVVGVNNRNLGSFVTDLQNSVKLIDKIKQRHCGKPIISESGISKNEEIKMLQNLGFKGFLIGESLMKSTLSI